MPTFARSIAARSPRDTTGLALGLLVFLVYLDLSKILVQELGAPSLLRMAAPVVFFMIWLESGRAAIDRVIRSPLAWLMAGYTLLLVLSTTYARVPALGDSRSIDNAEALAIALLLLAAARDAARLRTVARFMVAAGALLAGIGVLQSLGLVDGQLMGLARIKLAQIYAEQFDERIAGPLGDPNFFAQILIILVPIALALAAGARTLRGRSAALGAAAVLSAATLFTYSRGGAVALVVVILLALLARARDGRRLAALAVGVGLVAMLAMPSGLARRIVTLAEVLPWVETEVLDPDSSFEERRLLTGVAWAIFRVHPWLGVGAGNYTAHYEDHAAEIGSPGRDYQGPGTTRYPHSLYLEVAAETGVVGLILLGSTVLVAVGSLGAARVRLLGHGDAANAALARGVQIAFAGFLIAGLFLHLDFPRYLWLLFGLAAGFSAVSARPSPPARRPATTYAGGPPPRRVLSAAPPRASHSAARPPSLRAPVAVIVSRFPLITETFILREIIEMERQGQPVVLVPLLREETAVVHREAEPWLKRAIFTPLMNAAILRANLRALLASPARYIGLAARIATSAVTAPRYLLATLAYFPKSVYLAGLLRERGVAHVHAHFGSHPATAALVIREIGGIDYSFTIHAHDLFLRRYRPLLRRKVERAAVVRVISRFNREYLQRLYPGVTLDHVHVVHVGIVPEAYAAGNARAAATNRPPRLLCVAAHMPYKGLPVLIDACRMLRDRGVTFECDLIGDGPMRTELASRIDAVGLAHAVRLLGARPQHEVRQILADADVFVLPSIIGADGWMEGIPVALMEAMAAGKPVVASRLSGIPELVEDGVTGLLVEPGNADALADALHSLLLDSALRGTMGRAAPARIQDEFRLDECTAQLLGLLAPYTAAPSLPPGLDNAAAAIAAPDAALGLADLHTGPDSNVADLLVPGRGTGEPARMLVLKQHRDREGASRPAAARARAEFAVLRHLRLERMAVPEPLDLLEDGAALLMERCGGAPLSRLVAVARIDSAARPVLLRRLEDTGRWLRGFQAAPLPVPTESATATPAFDAHDHLAATVDRSFAMIDSRILSAGRAERLGRRLRALAAAAAESGLHAVPHHGDFGPGNVLVDDERVCVIDFEGFRAGLPFEDAAYFLVQLELFFARPGSRSLFDDAEAAFLRGWRDTDEPSDGLLLGKALTALSVLGREAHDHSARAWLRRRALRGILARVAR